MTPLKEWILWIGNTPKKITEIFYVSKFQKAFERHIERKRVKNYRKAMASTSLDKEALQALKKINRLS